MCFWVKLVAVALNHDCLGCTLLTNEKHRFALFGNAVDEEISPVENLKVLAMMTIKQLVL